VKDRRRKPKPQREPKPLDDDLNELAAILDEHKLDQNAQGWFVVPWRDGWNAVMLAWESWRSLVDSRTDAELEIDIFLKNQLRLYQNPNASHGAMAGLAYERARELIEEHASALPTRHLLTALRCLQALLSNSHGGGHVYNTLLQLAFGKTEPDHLLEELVLEYRCRDAIGTTVVMQGNSLDRHRRAFTIAWKRGLYLAAYAIAPAWKS
jgi:hypothetical protein